MDTIALIGALEQVVVKSLPQLGVKFGDGVIAAQKASKDKLSADAANAEAGLKAAMP